jgi:hypothetical protein
VALIVNYDVRLIKRRCAPSGCNFSCKLLFLAAFIYKLRATAIPANDSLRPPGGVDKTGIIYSAVRFIAE